MERIGGEIVTIDPSFSEFNKLDEGIHHLREVMELRFDTLDREIVTAKERMDEKLVGMNALREQILQERGTYLTRERFDHEHSSLQNRVSAIELQNSRWSGSLWMLGGAVSGVVVLVNVALKLWIK